MGAGGSVQFQSSEDLKHLASEMGMEMMSDEQASNLEAALHASADESGFVGRGQLETILSDFNLELSEAHYQALFDEGETRAYLANPGEGP
mmetsp:Transcript_1170/g.2368  ORF Transcript_1170/g.2368 Transcript_1170/m.2368 type:complete len:91 (-) Transcript_1170:75-347(-)